eukprot:4892553-Alexandrium_andersonii.AAC.1
MEGRAHPARSADRAPTLAHARWPPVQATEGGRAAKRRGRSLVSSGKGGEQAKATAPLRFEADS